MLGADVTILQMPALLVRVEKYLLGFGSQVELGRLRYAVSKNDPLLDIASHSVNRQCISKWKKARRDGLVFTHQAKQDVLRRDDRRAVLQCLVASKENNAARAFGITFEHKISAQPFALL